MEEQKDKNEHTCCSHDDKEMSSEKDCCSEEKSCCSSEKDCCSEEKSCCSSEKDCCSSAKSKCCCHGGALKILVKIAIIVAIFSIGFHMGARNNHNEGNFEKNFGGRQMMNRNYIPANSQVVAPTPTPATNATSTK
ncbi:MAG: hypothetical protein WCK37_01550 [Candidatus Falkowbacteria bacterium]